MAVIDDRLRFLFQQFAANKCSREELQEFYEALNHAGDGELSELMTAHYQNLSISANAESVDWNSMFQQIVGKKSAAPVRKVGWLKYVAAAAIILMLGAGTYFAFFISKKNAETTATKESAPTDIKAPDVNRAMVTLANGQKVYLDSAINGQLAVQGDVKLVKLANGEIVYQDANGETAKELQYNTLTNPKGSQVIQMQLADGSRVWLNAASSVTYPVAFVGTERKVAITGEAYFEVAHDAAKPFLVSVNDMQVEVLGTHFNINAYADEATAKTTLLEGKVRITKAGNSALLEPGQQASADNSGLTISNHADIDEVMAWKNGLFHFNDASLQEVIRQIVRWYDVEVSYEGKIPERVFGGEISRNANLLQVLKILEKSNVHFTIEGKKLILTP